MDPKCIYCGLGTSVRFACPHCSRIADEEVKFYVCNQECQKAFWKQHKQQHRGFPSFFDGIGSRSLIKPSSLEEARANLANAKNLQRIALDLMPWRVMIDFEKADLNNDVMWIKEHWKAYRNRMVFHTLASLGIFQWQNFCQWIQEISVTDGTAKEALDLLQKHPGFGKRSDDIVYFDQPLQTL